MDSEKTGIDDLIYETEMRHRQREKCVDTEGGSGRMNREVGIDICTLLML